MLRSDLLICATVPLVNSCWRPISHKFLSHQVKSCVSLLVPDLRKANVFANLTVDLPML